MRLCLLAQTDRQTDTCFHAQSARTLTHTHAHAHTHTRTPRVHARLVVLHADVCERDEEEHPASDCKAQPLQLQTHLLHQGSIAAKRFKCGAPTCCVGVTQSTHRFWMLNAGCKSLLAFQPISNRTWTSLTANMTEVCSTSPPPIICSRWDHAFLLILIS